MLCFKLSLVLLIVSLVERVVGITSTELNVVGEEIKDIVGKDLKDLIKITDQNFRKGKVYDIKVLSANYPDVKVSAQDSTLAIEITNFDFKLTANWKIEIKVVSVKLKASGSVTLKANSIGLKLTLNIDTFRVLGCVDLIKTLDIKFSGNNINKEISSFIEKHFKKLVNSRMKTELRGKICKTVTRLIDNNRTKILGLLGITLKPTTTPKTTPRPLGTATSWPICIPGEPCRLGPEEKPCKPQKPLIHGPERTLCELHKPCIPGTGPEAATPVEPCYAPGLESAGPINHSKNSDSTRTILKPTTSKSTRRPPMTPRPWPICEPGRPCRLGPDLEEQNCIPGDPASLDDQMCGAPRFYLEGICQSGERCTTGPAGAPCKSGEPCGSGPSI